MTDLPTLSREAHPVFTDLDGSSVEIHVHTLTGAAPGPTVLLMSMLHGSEWLAHTIVSEVLRRVAEFPLQGRVVGVPVANPYAFRTASRFSADMQQVGFPNLNQCFGRAETSITSLTAKALTPVIQATDVLIDFHPGPWGSAWDVVAYGGSAATLPRSRELATVFGRPFINAMDIDEALGHSAQRVATEAGVPVVVPEVGGLGFSAADEDRWITWNVDGVLRVLAHLAMIDLPTDVGAGEPSLDVAVAWDVRPRHGGMIEPRVGIDRLGTTVREGEVLAELVNPVTLDVTEQLVAPADAIVLSVPRRHPVHPYNFAYALGRRPEAAGG